MTVRMTYLGLVVLLVVLWGTTSDFAETNNPTDGQQARLGLEHVTNAVSMHDIGKKILIVGQLGVPIGATVRITGAKRSRAFGFFDVDEVNGKRFRTSILVDGIEKWPEGVSVTLEGHENGQVGILRYMSHQAAGAVLGQQRMQTAFRPIRILTPVECSVSDWSLFRETSIAEVAAMVEDALRKLDVDRDPTGGNVFHRNTLENPPQVDGPATNEVPAAPPISTTPE